GGAAVGAGVAHAPQGKALVVVDAHGDADLQGLFGGHPAAAVADLAGVLDDLALAAAAGAGLLALHDSKGGALLLDDIAAAAAVGAGLGLAAGGRAAAAALGAGLLPGDGDVLFAAVDRLVKAQGDAHPDVLALTGGVGVGACAAPKPAEAAAEDVPEDVPQVHPAKAAEAAGSAALAGRVVGVHPRKAKLVVALALFRVGQDLVGLVDLLEFFLGGLVAGVVVRVVFQRQLTVGLLDLLVRGCLGYPQDLVIVTFFL